MIQKNKSSPYKMPKLLEYKDKTKVEVYLLRSIDHINSTFMFGLEKIVFFDIKFWNIKSNDFSRNIIKKNK
jgi:hypothetical protein